MNKNNLHIKADRDLIRQLLLVNAIDDVDEFNKMNENDRKKTIDYWVEHYYDDYTLEDLKEENLIDELTFFREKMQEEYNNLKLDKNITFQEWYEQKIFNYYLTFINLCGFCLVVNDDKNFSLKDIVAENKIENENFLNLKSIVKKLIEDGYVSEQILHDIKYELASHNFEDIELKELQEKILADSNYEEVIRDVYELIDKEHYFSFFVSNCNALKIAYYIDKLDELENSDLIKKYLYVDDSVEVNDLKYIREKINELSKQLEESLSEYMDDGETIFGRYKEVIEKLENQKNEITSNMEDEETKNSIIQKTDDLILELVTIYDPNDFVVLVNNPMIDFYAIQADLTTLKNLKDIEEELKERKIEEQEEIKKNTIYKVITHDDYIEEGINSSDVKVFKDEEIARKYLERLISNAKQDIEDYELDDYEISEDETSYERYLKGRSCEDYISIKFEKDTFFDERELAEEIKELQEKIEQNELDEIQDEEEDEEER